MEIKNQVSVIVPCYNQVAYISETLKSVFDQSYIHWECIIVNDGSTDSSEEVALEWINKDSRFKYFLIPNGGVSKARNFGIQKSEGQYILPLDADDKISKYFLAACIDQITLDEKITLVYAEAQLFGIRRGKWSFGPYSYTRLLHINMICCTALFKRKDFNNTIGYNENMKLGLEDWDFWLSLLNKDSKVVKVKSADFFYRIKTASRSTNLTKQTEVQMRRQIYHNHLLEYNQLLPDFISLYNENLFLKKRSLYLMFKNIAKKIIQSTQK